MQETSALYKEIIASDNYWFETTLVIGEKGRLIDTVGDVITFGGTAILVDTGGPDSGFDESQLISIKTDRDVFNKNIPVVGSTVSGRINITMLAPLVDFPKMARLVPYVRATDGEHISEWLSKGVYYIDTRYKSHNDDGLDILTIYGYDSMLMFEEDYPNDTQHNYPLLDITMVEHIANSIGVSVDARTRAIMTEGYRFPLPIGYSSREVLGMIAASYGGNFVMSDVGELRLVMLNELPPETGLLLDHAGNHIVFGEDRINIWQVTL